MKIAVTTQGTNLNSPLAPRFGRCPYFIIYDDEKGPFEVVENSGAPVGGGAGLRAAELLSEQGVEVVLTGSVDPHAQRGLETAGIQVYIQTGGTVEESIAAYIEDKGSCELKG